MIFFQSTKENLGCYRLPPLKEISSPRFEEARRVEGFGVLRWLPPLKETFVGSPGLWFKVSTPGICLGTGHLLNP
jgi:hypothetical protein